jgi:inosine-uridine nucleoside N-ribohydrolase
MLLHIDTDMGVDDGLALFIASRLAEVQIIGVSTVFGNVDRESATLNAQLFRRLLLADWPIYSGAAEPTRGPRRNAARVHGEDGLGGATKLPDLAEYMHQAAETKVLPLSSLPRTGAPVTILGLGPTTNIPTIVEHYGRENVAAIVVMGGVFFDQGNISKTAEFNAGCDPDALQRVSELDIPFTMVPLDVTTKVLLPRGTVRAWAHDSPMMDLIVTSHMYYMDQYQTWEAIDGCFPHDSIALLAAIYPERFWRLPGQIEVAQDGTTRILPDERSSAGIVTGGDLRFVRLGLQRLQFDGGSR